MSRPPEVNLQGFPPTSFPQIPQPISSAQTHRTLPIQHQSVEKDIYQGISDKPQNVEPTFDSRTALQPSFNQSQYPQQTTLAVPNPSVGNGYIQQNSNWRAQGEQIQPANVNAHLLKPNYGFQQVPVNQPFSSPQQQRLGTETASAAPNLDSLKLPSPITSSHCQSIKVVYDTTSLANPPPAHSKYIVEEKYGGTCSPRYIRSTVHKFPISKDLLAQGKLPFAVIIQPFSEPRYGEEDVPVVSMGEKGPIRCRRCSAYINPFVTWLDNGRFYNCSLCGTQNSIPDEYFSPIESNGLRQDIADRIELCRPSVDFIASPDFVVNRPLSSIRSPIIFFLLDTSSYSFQLGLPRAFANSLEQILEYHFAENADTKFGFITFDKCIHFWQFHPRLQKVVVPNIQQAFEPKPLSSITADYATCKDKIVTWLREVVKTNKEGNSESCFGAAVSMALLNLRKLGGRVIAFQASLPSHGPGSLKQRDKLSAYGQDEEKHLYVPQSKFYTKVANEYAKSFVAFDLFVCSNVYVDLCDISQLCQLTGGEVHYISNFNPQYHEEKIFYDLRHSLIRKHGLDAICKLRCGESLSVDRYEGNFKPGDTDIEFCTIDCDKVFIVYLKHDDVLQENKNSVIQFAMVYTSEAGVRLIRVHTAYFAVASTLPALYRSASIEAVLSVLLRRGTSKFGRQSLTQIQKYLTEHVANILCVYRKNCVKRDCLTTQLILPEALKLLPIYILSALKHVLFANPIFPTQEGIVSIIDSRIYFAQQIKTAALELLEVLFYPRIYPLHPLYDYLQLGTAKNEYGDFNSESEEDVTLYGLDDFYGSYWLPHMVRATAGQLEAGCVYLVDDSQKICLLFTSPINGAIFNCLVDNQWQFKYNEDDKFNLRVQRMICAIRFCRASYQPIYVFDLNGDTIQKKQLISKLVEDGTNDNLRKGQTPSFSRMSYVSYLCYVHRLIQDAE
ncbi:uncharacterized protein LOC126315235 isoform X2 [Schistocerca gregaria]|uniref:uncharacterized protein LOC126315235 isoform X2 n=1 Tax=Schistocerca gregaria TaxID=7010 RepID=UPI00211F099E|nr:uncharacterized protein LOC126315235 isoform X2 [Schistocerca gregaria]